MSKLLLPTPISFQVASQTPETRFTTTNHKSTCKGLVLWTWSVSDDLNPRLRHSLRAAESRNCRGYGTSATASATVGADSNRERGARGRGQKSDDFNGAGSGDEQRQRGHLPPAELRGMRDSTKPAQVPHDEKDRRRSGPQSARSLSAIPATKDRRASNPQGSGRRPIGRNRFDDDEESESAAAAVEEETRVRGRARIEPAGASASHSESPSPTPALPTYKGQRGPACPPGMCWRLLNVEVAAAMDPGKDDYSVHTALRAAAAARLGCQEHHLDAAAVAVVRKSFDARKVAKFVYAVDVLGPAVASAMAAANASPWRLREKPQHLQLVPLPKPQPPPSARSNSPHGYSAARTCPPPARRTVVVGSGPAGLFAALELAEGGEKVVVVERGQGVERRGRDIGALVVRRVVDGDSNFCFGEGGAGTWSDGKLTTRIGKHSEEVRAVLGRLVQLGASERILVDGKPHLGTDQLVHVLKRFRGLLQDLGVEMRFGFVMRDLVVAHGRIAGLQIAPAGGGGGDSALLPADRVVIATGHSARDVYGTLQRHGVALKAKDFAVGFRVEHPQALINQIQYGQLAAEVDRGRGPIPVADYSLTAKVGEGRGCYSFCMCPGGQVVPTSTCEEELCVNGMSFSRRNSLWANAALVVSTGEADFEHLMEEHGALAGVEFQRGLERKAALMGGGKFVVPVQRVTDFLQGTLSEGPLPSSSYRLGVKAAPLHQIYPPRMTEALREGLRVFERQLPGFISPEGLLHGVETRTSSAVRIERDPLTFESLSLPGLVVVGEGAGYAGGIVSAAVDGMKAGRAMLRALSSNSSSSS